MSTVPVRIPLPPPEAGDGLRQLPVGRWFLLAGAVVALIFTIATVVTVASLVETRAARVGVVDVVDPAALRVAGDRQRADPQESSVRAYGSDHEATGSPASGRRSPPRSPRWPRSRLMPQMPDEGRASAEVAR